MYKNPLYLNKLRRKASIEMGTWSRPLFARTTPSSSCTFSIKNMSPELLSVWRNAGFFNQEEGKTEWTLHEFMNTGCDSHKIYDHMTSSQIERWIHLFQLVIDQNPGLETIELHFFCSDSSEPYYLYWRKGNAKLWMLVGSSDSIYYMEPNPDYVEGTDDPKLRFNEQKYRSNLDAIGFQAKELRVNPHGLLDWMLH